jgi:hypothetical protein
MSLGKTDPFTGGNCDDVRQSVGLAGEKMAVY